MSKKIGLSIFNFQRRYGDREALRIAKEIGCDAVDFDIGSEEPNKETSVYFRGDEAVREYYSELGAYAKELGLIISQTHGRCCSYINDPEHDRITLEKTRLDCLATAALGAPIVVVHNINSTRMGPDADPEFMQEFCYKMRMDMLPFAKQYGVKISTETFGKSAKYNCRDFFGSQENFMKNLKMVKESEYGEYYTVCIDTGHCNLATPYGEPSPADVIRQVGKEVTTLHLNDNDAITDQHKIPLAGTVDWKDVLDALDEIGYDGVYNMELKLDTFGKGLLKETAAFAVKVMKNMLKERYGE